MKKYCIDQTTLDYVNSILEKIDEILRGHHESDRELLQIAKKLLINSPEIKQGWNTATTEIIDRVMPKSIKSPVTYTLE